MKKRIYILSTIILGVAVFDSYAQNLVPNYSFEDTLQCPIGNGISPITYSPPWFSPTNSTANYFNSCNNFSWGVPNNVGGIQYARTGKSYAGIINLSSILNL